MRAAVEADSSHPWTAAAYLELGNGEAAQGKLAEAEVWFERLGRERPSSPYAAPASFNLAELRVRSQQFARATPNTVDGFRNCVFAAASPIAIPPAEFPEA